MLVGLLIGSILTGAFATSVALAAGLPIWVAILAYPFGGAAGLLLSSALLGLRSANTHHHSSLLAVQVSTLGHTTRD